MLLSLGGIALVASALLGFAYQATKGPIAETNKKILNAAIKVVSPEGEITVGTKYMIASDKDSLACYPVTDASGKLVATAISTYTKLGFSGRFDIMVGFKPDGTIINTSVLSHAETPGLGDKMSVSKSPWSNQFQGKNPKDFNLKVTKDGGDVDAITAATISSRAFSDAATRAYNAYMKGGRHE
ncbi:MAG: RnfABCDGE type electron transport complex subunit G [Bacteroidales bacterium]|nr:RnfABCDGE type electron transport complex subunit G [Bacteroidales bacterium]